MGIELRPACSPADAELEVMHNLYNTEDWTWQVKSPDGEVVTLGRLVAFQGKDIGGKITRAAVSPGGDGISKPSASEAVTKLGWCFEPWSKRYMNETKRKWRVGSSVHPLDGNRMQMEQSANGPVEFSSFVTGSEALGFDMAALRA